MAKIFHEHSDSPRDSIGFANFIKMKISQEVLQNDKWDLEAVQRVNRTILEMHYDEKCYCGIELTPRSILPFLEHFYLNLEVSVPAAKGLLFFKKNKLLSDYLFYSIICRFFETCRNNPHQEEKLFVEGLQKFFNQLDTEFNKRENKPFSAAYEKFKAVFSTTDTYAQYPKVFWEELNKDELSEGEENGFAENKEIVISTQPRSSFSWFGP